MVGLAALQALTGCGPKPPQAGPGGEASPETQTPSREIALLQQQIQQTERSSMPPQIKQQVEANLNAQIQTKRQTLNGQ